MKRIRPGTWIALAAVLGVGALGLLGWTAFTITSDLSEGVPEGALGPLVAMGAGAIALIAIFIVLRMRR